MSPGQRPLAGLVVVVTRSAGRSAGLVGSLERLGATALELAVTETADPADGGRALAAALARAEPYTWVAFTSATAVERCWRQPGAQQAIGRSRLAAVGAVTAAALTGRGAVVDLVPPEFVAESLLSVFPPPSGDRSVLLPCAAGAREVLADGLRSAGWSVDVVEAYRTVTAAPGAEALARAAVADVITFASSSAVSAYLELACGRCPPVVACIGPVTAATAEGAGLRVEVVAAEHSSEGLVAALVEWAEHSSGDRAGR